MYESMIIFLGFVAGFCVAMLGLSNNTALDNCAKTHNVYQCEMVAVPVAGESK